MTTQETYRSASTYFRKRLNAGCPIEHSFRNNGRLCDAPTEAARTVILSSGRKPASRINLGLHYQITYMRNAHSAPNHRYF